LRCARALPAHGSNNIAAAAAQTCRNLLMTQFARWRVYRRAVEAAAAAEGDGGGGDVAPEVAEAVPYWRAARRRAVAGEREHMSENRLGALTTQGVWVCWCGYV
jgi:hypothetical protein